MENNERDRKLEQWLDEALSEYNAAEPRFGLEQRVLNRVHGEEKARTGRWNLWKWMPAFAAIAAVAIIGVAIRPMLVHNSAPLQTNSRLEQQVSSQHSEEKIVAQTADGAVAGPVKKALVTRGVHAQLRDQRESQGKASPARADSAKVELKDADRASSAFNINGNLPANERTTVPAPASPQVTTSGRSYQSLTVIQPGSGAGASKNGTMAAQTAAVTSEQPTIQGAGRDQGQIPTETIGMVPIKPATMDAKAAENAPTGIVGVESVAVAKETAAFKRVKTKKAEQDRADKARAEDRNVIDVFGMRLRTEIKQSAAGPMQFPTPAPLSEQEKLVLAAAKKMKDLPVKQDVQGGEIPAVEIKAIEIKPLEGPKK